MYYPVGWPRLLSSHQSEAARPIRITANRDRILLAGISLDSIVIWYAKPCLPIISHRRSQASIDLIGTNSLLVWRPDSSMLCVATTSGHLVFYNLVVLTDISSLYTQSDSDNPALRRDSDELYFKENVPPLVFSQAFEISVPGGVTDISVNMSATFTEERPYKDSYYYLLVVSSNTVS